MELGQVKHEAFLPRNNNKNTWRFDPEIERIANAFEVVNPSNRASATLSANDAASRALGKSVWPEAPSSLLMNKYFHGFDWPEKIGAKFYLSKTKPAGAIRTGVDSVLQNSIRNAPISTINQKSMLMPDKNPLLQNETDGNDNQSPSEFIRRLYSGQL